MSNRVLKKLYGDNQELAIGPNVVEGRVSESDSDSLSNDNSKLTKNQKNKKLAINRFELVNVTLVNKFLSSRS